METEQDPTIGVLFPSFIFLWQLLLKWSSWWSRRAWVLFICCSISKSANFSILVREENGQANQMIFRLCRIRSRSWVLQFYFANEMLPPARHLESAPVSQSDQLQLITKMSRLGLAQQSAGSYFFSFNIKLQSKYISSGEEEFYSRNMYSFYNDPKPPFVGRVIQKEINQFLVGKQFRKITLDHRDKMHWMWVKRRGSTQKVVSSYTNKS